MKALVYNLNIPKYLITRFLSKKYPKKFFSLFSNLKLKEIAEPKLINEDFVKVKTIKAGICGSDINTIFAKESFSMEAYSSFPFVMGHENVGLIVEKGKNVSEFSLGERVIVEPLLPCRVKGFLDCEFCKKDLYNLCYNYSSASSYIDRGGVLGFNKSTYGSFGEFFLAHKTQIFRLPINITDDEAILIDSIASSMHPVINNFPNDNDIVLVYGCGILGINTIICLRALGFKGTIIAIYRYEFQKDLAIKKGATYCINKNLYEEIQRLTNSRLVTNSFAKPVLEGGVDIVYECIGTSDTIDNSLRFLKPKGKLVLIATTGVTKNIDFSFIWFRELNIVGSAMYSFGYYNGKKVKIYDLVIDLIKNKKIDTSGLITHRFKIDDYKNAIQTLIDKKAYKSTKVIFEF